MDVQWEDCPINGTNNLMDNIGEGEVLAQALRIIQRRLRKPGEILSGSQLVKDYLTIKLAEKEHEVFAVLFLDGQNRLIEYVEMFRGTLTQTSVYPREVVKEALRLNAGAVVFAHNHPSCVAEQSRTDEELTSHLKSALALVDVKVVDHIIVAGASTVSFAEKGLI